MPLTVLVLHVTNMLISGGVGRKGIQPPSFSQPSAFFCNSALIVLVTADTSVTCPNLSWLWFQTEKWFCCSEKDFIATRGKYLQSLEYLTVFYWIFWKTCTALILMMSSLDRVYMGSVLFFLIILMHCKSFPNHKMYWRHHTLLNYTWSRSEGTKEK